MIESRIRAGLREHADALPVHPDLAAVVSAGQAGGSAVRAERSAGQARGRQSRSNWLAPVLAAVAVVMVVFGVTLVPLPSRHGARPAAGSASIPDRFPGFSYLTGKLPDAPLGRAIALYRNGPGHEDASLQPVVAGADRNAYRRLVVPSDLYNGYGGLLLFPDGTRVVAGNADKGGLGLTVIDLATARLRHYPVQVSSATYLLAVSPDSRYVAYLALRGTSRPEGSLWLLDLVTGVDTQIDDGAIRGASFASDSRRLVIAAESSFRIVGVGGTVERELPRLASSATWQSLAGPATWSPDGKLLAVEVWGPDDDTSNLGSELKEFVFLDATGSGAPVPQPIAVGEPSWGHVYSMLGWTSPTTLLLSTGDGNTMTSDLIVEVSVTDGGHNVISRFDVEADDEHAVMEVQLATALLPQLAVRPGGEPDRGPWPVWAKVTGWGFGGFLVVAAPLSIWLIRVIRRHPRHRWAANSSASTTGAENR